MIVVQSDPTCLEKHLTKKKKKEDTNQNFKKQKNCCTYTHEWKFQMTRNEEKINITLLGSIFKTNFL